MSVDEAGGRRGSETKKKKNLVKKKHSSEDGVNTSATDDSETEGVAEKVKNDKKKRNSPKSKLEKHEDRDAIKLKYFDSFKDRRDRVTPQENLDNNDHIPNRNSFKVNKHITRNINTPKRETFPPNDVDKKTNPLENEISSFKYADGSEVRIFTSDRNLDNVIRTENQCENEKIENHGARVIAKMELDSSEYLDNGAYHNENNFVTNETGCYNSNSSCATANATNFPNKFHKRSGSDILSQMSKFNHPHLQDCVSAPSLNSKDTSLQGLNTRGQTKRAKITRFYSQHYHQNKGELRVVEPLISQDSTKSSLAAVWGAKQESIRKINRKTNLSRKLSSWEERTNVERRRSLAGRGTASAHVASTPAPAVESDSPGPVAILPITLPPYLDTKDLRYCFQHPYLRLLTTSSVIFCNFLMFAEDPISHSQAESFIPVVGNVFSFIFTKYPPDWRWALVKVLMWILAILCGLVFGKIFIHDIIFGKYMRLKMFRDEQGSWILMFLTVILSMYLFSHIYNFILFIFYSNSAYAIDSHMGLSNSTVMKAAVCGTWLGDLVTLLMVLDVMLQDSLYPAWAPSVRIFCRKSNAPRVVLFWVGSALATGLVVTLVVTESLSWDALNRDLLTSTELTRAFLASFILVLDLVIMMQDWDFPHFTTTVHINLPGFSVARLQWKYAEVNLTGKWFSYGVIFMVMLLDLNMWQNQIFYYPQKFGQYVGPDNKIRTVLNLEQIFSGNSTLDWESRSKLNPNTQQPYYSDDLVMNSRYMGYPMILKCTAFLPSIITLSIYLCLIYLYGRFPQIKEKVILSSGSEPQESETESEDGGISV